METGWRRDGDGLETGWRWDGDRTETGWNEAMRRVGMGCGMGGRWEGRVGKGGEEIDREERGSEERGGRREREEGRERWEEGGGRLEVTSPPACLRWASQTPLTHPPLSQASTSYLLQRCGSVQRSVP